MYLGLCLGPYSILVTAGSGGICIYSYYSCCGCYGVARAVIKITSGVAIRTTYSVAVKIASGISRVVGGIKILFIDLACCASCLGAVGVRGDVLILK